MEKLTGQRQNQKQHYKTFYTKIRAAGCRCGVYSSDYNFKAKMMNPYYDRDSVWIARHSDKKPESRAFDMWQHTSKGSVAGIAGTVDMNYLYKESILERVPGNKDAAQYYTIK